MHNAQIIPKKSLSVETHWQKELANSFTSVDRLLEYLQITTDALSEYSAARKLFAMRVPRPFADLMKVGDLNDPLLKQVLPSSQEFIQKAGFVSDPLQEHSNQQPGLIHKYQSRVLVVLKGACAVNCRYCFRRDFPYKENHVSADDLQSIVTSIKANPAINEVILSGGDPLMSNDTRLSELILKLENIPHVKRLRIHTRLPVVIPSRMTHELIQCLSTTSLNVLMVLHINHANEISSALIEKTELLRRSGVHMLNQSVLLRGINDGADVLEDLSERLFSAGILPYYLHLLDPVRGASHFDVSKQDAIVIMAELIKRLPGFLVPKLVKEIGGQPGKTPIDLGLEP